MRHLSPSDAPESTRRPDAAPADRAAGDAALLDADARSVVDEPGASHPLHARSPHDGETDRVTGDSDSHHSSGRFRVGLVLGAIAIAAGGWGLYRIGTADPTGRSELALPAARLTEANGSAAAQAGAGGLNAAPPTAGGERLGDDRVLDVSPGNGSLAYALRPEGYPAISRPNRTVPLSFVVAGLIEAVDVAENQVVTPGQVLIRLDDDVQRWTVEAQKVIAADQTDLEAALARHEMAAFDLSATNEAKSKEATSPRDEIRAVIEERIRANELEAARYNLEQARLLLSREQARLDQMAIRSSIDGVVVEISAREGQAIDAYEPVMVVVSIDPLWLSVPVPMQLGLHVKEGDACAVRWRDLPDHPGTQGRVLFVSPVSDASSNSIMVRVEVPNEGNTLPAGLHALVQFPEAMQRLQAPSRPQDNEKRLDAAAPPWPGVDSEPASALDGAAFVAASGIPVSAANVGG